MLIGAQTYADFRGVLLRATARGWGAAAPIRETFKYYRDILSHIVGEVTYGNNFDRRTASGM